jgi:lysozyme family protein
MLSYTEDLPNSYLHATLQYEGGYVNNPNDRGGETNRGITYGTLQAAIKQGLVAPTVTIRSLTNDLESVRKIYNINYYRKGQCPKIPHSLAFAHFDACVHNGIGGAGKFMQKMLNKYLGKKPLTVDGAVGPATLSALRDVTAVIALPELIEVYMDLREAKFLALASDPTQKGFLKGWLNRVKWVKEWCRTH